jgi:hypothetical protein
MVDKRQWETFKPVTMGHIRSHGCCDLLVYCVSGTVPSEGDTTAGSEQHMRLFFLGLLVGTSSALRAGRSTRSCRTADPEEEQGEGAPAGER